jgi:hypothetical protein
LKKIFAIKRYLGRIRGVQVDARFDVTMVAVAQLVELRIVIPAVAGSRPVSHPILPLFLLLLCNTTSTIKSFEFLH